MPDYRRVNPTQMIFRALVEAMSHPGRMHQMPAIDDSYPWSSCLLSIVHTLFDHEIGFAVIAPNGPDHTTQEIYAATKASVVDLGEADYIVVEGSDSGGKIKSAQKGKSAFPDKGATVIYRLDSDTSNLDAARGDVILTGPGINGRQSPEMPGISTKELKIIREVNSEYPLGVDCIFLNRDNRVMCVPRSTRIELRRA